MDRAHRLLPDLPVLAAFAETGQVTATADVLRMPQPQVSRSLARMEGIVGVALRERDGRHVRPSRAARELGAAAAKALDQVGAALTAVTQDVSGDVSIVFQHSLGESFIPRLVRSLTAAYPSVTFTLIQGSRPECLAALDAGRADVGFVAIPPDPVTYSHTHIATEELVLAVSRTHPLASHTTVTSGDLNGEPLILLRHGMGLRTTIDTLLASWGVHATVAFEGQEITTLVGLVGAGLGITIVPRRTYPDDVTLIPFRHDDATRPLVMVTARHRAATRASQLLTDHVHTTMTPPIRL